MVGCSDAFLQEALRERGAALMGVVNVTPDSFFDGGRYSDEQAAQSHVDRLLAEGADILDIGGESSRPGSKPVPAAEQVRRIRPVVVYAQERGARVSVDTTSPEVAERMLDAGAWAINDVSCLADEELARVAARYECKLICMHARGPMSQMRGFSDYPTSGYQDVVADVRREWCAARDVAVRHGVKPERFWFDPGLGFAKNARHSLELLARLDELTDLGVTLVGPSRKSFIGSVDESPPESRLGGTVAACLAAVERGAHVLRVHDVAQVRQALSIARAIGAARNVAAGEESRRA